MSRDDLKLALVEGATASPRPCLLVSEPGFGEALAMKGRQGLVLSLLPWRQAGKDRPGVFLTSRQWYAPVAPPVVTEGSCGCMESSGPGDGARSFAARFDSGSCDRRPVAETGHEAQGAGLGLLELVPSGRPGDAPVEHPRHGR